MKYCIILLFTLFSLNINAQGYPPIEDGSKNIEQLANEITDSYDSELAMTYKEKQLFKTVVEDFLILRQDVLKTKKGKAQLDALTKLQAEETLRMKDILRQPQIDLYKKLKPKIQPLKIIEKEED